MPGRELFHMAKSDYAWLRTLWRGSLVVCVVVVLLGVAASLGQATRTMLRVPPPDGRLVPVCRAIPVFDGPDYEMRLERPEGTLVTPVHRIGDGGPCLDMLWAR